MLKKAITYTDLDGVTVTEEYHFQIDKSEAVKIMMIEGEDYADKLQNLVKQRDGKKIMDAFDELLMAAVGRREGKLFIKDKDISRQFRYSGAYNSFFMELINMPDSGASVLTAMFPADAQDEIAKVMKEHNATVTELPSSGVIEGGVSDSQVQAEKPQPDTIPEPNPYPQVLEQLIEENRTQRDKSAEPSVVSTPNPSSDNGEPAWYRETRYPTKQELMKMGTEEMQLAMKMKSAKAFG